MKRLLLNVFLLSTLLFLVACGASNTPGEQSANSPIVITNPDIKHVGDFGPKGMFSLYEYTSEKTGETCLITIGNATTGIVVDTECTNTAESEE